MSKFTDELRGLNKAAKGLTFAQELRAVPSPANVRPVPPKPPELVDRHRPICLACDQHTLHKDGRITCPNCRCGDAPTRPRCPGGKWGITPASGCVHLRDIGPGACALGHADCAGCPDRQEQIPKITGDNFYSLGVVFPVRNEKPHLMNSIKSFRASVAPGTKLRFFVIDDGSEDGGCDGLENEPDVTLIRHAKAQGEAASRNEGSEAAMAFGVDGFSVHDAHEEMSPGGLELMAEAAIKTGGVICATTWMLQDHTTKDFPRYGGRFDWRPAHTVQAPKGNLGLRVEWAYQHGEVLQPVKIPYGASYMMTPDTFRKLGGWMDRAGEYGFGEQAMAIECFFLGIPVYCHTQATVKHFFRVARPYRMSGIHFWRNMVYCAKILFSDETFRRVFLPVTRGSVTDPICRELEESPEVAKLRDEFAPRKTRTDEECLEWMGITMTKQKVSPPVVQKLEEMFGIEGRGMGIEPPETRKLEDDFARFYEAQNYPRQFGRVKSAALVYDEAFLLYALVAQFRPIKIVELGTMRGCATRLLLDAKKILGLDGRITSYNVMDENRFVRDGEQGVELKLEDLTGRFKAEVLDKHPPGMIFLDAHPYHLLKDVISSTVADGRWVLAMHDCDLAEYKPVMKQTKEDPNITSKTGVWERHVLAEIFGVKDAGSAALDGAELNGVRLRIFPTLYGLSIMLPRKS